jgi:hypothetical protein
MSDDGGADDRQDHRRPAVAARADRSRSLIGPVRLTEYLLPAGNSAHTMAFSSPGLVLRNGALTMARTWSWRTFMITRLRIAPSAN